LWLLLTDLSSNYRGNAYQISVCFLQHPHDHNLDYDLSDNGHLKTQIISLTFQSQSFFMKRIPLN
jgi:hypothetical protein